MAYTPTEWQSGDIVTSAKLNKIEQGIAGAGGGGDLPDLFSLYVAHDLDNDTYIPNCTLSDFLTAYLEGKGIIGTIGEYTIIYVTVTEIESNQCAFFYTLSPFTQSLVNPSITTMYVDMYTWSTDGFAFTAESSVSLTPGQ